MWVSSRYNKAELIGDYPGCIAYIVAAVMAWGMFTYCSLGGYHAISLYDEEESEDTNEAPFPKQHEYVSRREDHWIEVVDLWWGSRI